MLFRSPLLTCCQRSPLHRKMVPVSPTAHKSSGELPHTERTGTIGSSERSVQRVPSQWVMTPLSPTAQTSFGPLPPTPCRLCPVAVPGADDQTEPFHRMTPPFWVTPQRSLGPLAHNRYTTNPA